MRAAKLRTDEAYQRPPREVRSLVWTKRGDTKEAKDACRRAFRHSDVLADLKRKDETIAGHYESLYEHLIDSGAHPNEFGFMTSLKIEELAGGGAVFQQIYLQDQERFLNLGLKATGQVGVCVLKMFERMYPDLFKELGISGRIPFVSSGI